MPKFTIEERPEIEVTTDLGVLLHNKKCAEQRIATHQDIANSVCNDLSVQVPIAHIQRLQHQEIAVLLTPVRNLHLQRNLAFVDPQYSEYSILASYVVEIQQHYMFTCRSSLEIILLITFYISLTFIIIVMRNFYRNRSV